MIANELLAAWRAKPPAAQAWRRAHVDRNLLFKAHAVYLLLHVVALAACAARGSHEADFRAHGWTPPPRSLDPRSLVARWSWFAFGLFSLLFDLAIFRSAGLRALLPFTMHHSMRFALYGFACAYPDDDDGYAASYYFALYSAAFSVGVLCRATSNRAFVVADLVWFAALIPQRLFMYADDRSSAFGVPLALVLALIDISNGIQKVGRGIGRACRPPEGDVEGGAAEVYACTSCELLLGVLAGPRARRDE